MSKHILTPRLRIHLFSASTRYQCRHSARTFSQTSRHHAEEQQHCDEKHDYTKRIGSLQAAFGSISKCYPRLPQISTGRVTKGSLEKNHGGLEPDQTAQDSSLTITGRIRSIRYAGSKLLFVDIQLPDGSLQAVCNLCRLLKCTDRSEADFNEFVRVARKGDVYAITGNPHRTARGELSLLASDLPKLLSPSLHLIPPTLQDPEARARNRHVDMLVNSEAILTLLVRHEVEASIQKYFHDHNFVKVNTPILSSSAGGAAARPFETKATELPDDKLHLRIAPELWLKRLIVGGMDKIYEIGPAFRNEGVDATHNPEFNICEFYQTYATLPDLMQTTEEIIKYLVQRITRLSETGKIPALLDSCNIGGQYARFEFIPTLERELNQRLPNLDQVKVADLEEIFKAKGIPLPSNPTVPRLLDALSALYLEPLSHDRPIFIINHPACMSPLSKHFDCHRSGQRVAARAELFFAGREYANMYEEENSPFEQRQKLEEQHKQRQTDKEAMEMDESYLQALEWGMPPTGGWGCGIDRLVMLFSGRRRMADVLPFGTVRNVVALGSRKSK